MTARTWTGRTNTSAGFAKNWGPPTGSPMAGDTLTMNNTGTMMISGNDLAGDTLTVGGNPQGANHSESIALMNNAVASIDVVNRAANVNINAMGADTLNLRQEYNSGSNVDVTLQRGSVLNGTFNLINPSVTVHDDPVFPPGAGGPPVLHNGTSSMVGGSVILNTTVDGGSWNLASYSSVPSTLEFGGTATHQNVTVGGDPQKNGSYSVIC